MIRIAIQKDLPQPHNGHLLEVSIGSHIGDRVEYREDKAIRIILGVGKEISKKIPTSKELAHLVRRAVSMVRKEKITQFVMPLSSWKLPKLKITDRQLGEIISTNILLANYEYVRFKTPPKDGFVFIKEVTIVGKSSPMFLRGVQEGQIIGEAINSARDLANTPGGEMTPAHLARDASEAIKGLKITCKVLGVSEMQKLGMGGILGVGKGSDVPPRFIILEYKGTGDSVSKKDDPIVLIGKGVTFDTGGLNLKPSNSIYEMHMDMAGGASVIHAVCAAAKLKIKKHVIGLIPAVENMPSGSSYRPGDVLYAMDGQTIEVMNTDAEGRIILADALAYATTLKPKLVIDVATLTGAACVALGNKANALFTRNDKLAERINALSHMVHDPVWRMPLWEEYEADIKGAFGDWSNTGKSRDGGAIQGAVFLQQFAKAYPWAHIDIAPRMTSVDGEHLSKGASGTPTALLIKLLEVL